MFSYNARHAMKPSMICLYWLLCAGVQAQPELVTTSDALLRQSVEGVPTKEVIVNKVSIPPYTELPWHWHHGEEIFYVIEGEVTLAQRGKPDLLSRVGEVNTIAPGVIHTGRTGEEGATLVIFRVHDKGQPERVVVD
jgi:quercetin dioxygenase-like cupin family protein